MNVKAGSGGTGSTRHKSDNLQNKLRYMNLNLALTVVGFFMLFKTPRYFALFKALFLGVSPKLEDYFEATLRLGRGEAVCKLFSSKMCVVV